MPDNLARHLAERGVAAAVVADGDATPVVQQLLADGWTYDGEETASGKRVRYLVPPADLAARLQRACPRPAAHMRSEYEGTWPPPVEPRSDALPTFTDGILVHQADLNVNGYSADQHCHACDSRSCGIPSPHKSNYVVPEYRAPFEPVHPCRRTETRHCPASYKGKCGDRPCARFESADETPWLPEIKRGATGPENASPEAASLTGLEPPSTPIGKHVVGANDVADAVESPDSPSDHALHHNAERLIPVRRPNGLTGMMAAGDLLAAGIDPAQVRMDHIADDRLDSLHGALLEAEMNASPSAGRETGILPEAHRCADCTFATASVGRMDGHLRATGHRHESEE